MSYITHDLTQGEPAWLVHRSKHRNGSDSAAMLGLSSYKTRSALLHETFTGVTPEFDSFAQQRFADGHAYEAAARPLVERELGEELYPVVVSRVVDGIQLSASLDGTDMAGEMTWEHKTLNEALAESLKRGEIPAEYEPQLEQGLLITGAKRCLFSASNGTPESLLSVWYEPKPIVRAKLLAGWKQFDADLAAYTPQASAPDCAPAPIAQLPAIIYKLNGLALTSNLDAYKAAAQRLVEDSKKPLETDQDFADREAMNKAFKEAEDRIELVRGQVIGEIKDVDQFSRELGHIGELIRQARLNGEKQVKARKEAIRGEILAAGSRAFFDHVNVINKRLGKVSLPPMSANFIDVMKGKKTLTSLKDAVDTELARVKIEANAAAEKISENLASLRDLAADHAFLFADAQQLVMKANDDLVMLIKSRIGEHKAKLERDAEAQRERIRQEERAKLAVEAPTPSPAPPAASPLPKVAPIGAKPRMRADGPTDDQIVEVLSQHYRVHEMDVIKWLLRMDLEGASKRAAKEFA